MKHVLLSCIVLLLTHNFKGQPLMWGAASGAAECGLGSVFSVAPSSTSFTSNSYLNSDYAGVNPFGYLVQGSNGKLFGTSQFGGKYGSGVIFEYDLLNNTYIKRFDFDGPNGAYPQGLTAGANGKFYGTTYNGGASNAGVIYEYDPLLNICVKKFDFSGSTGTNPGKKLALGSNGKLYGVTSGAGNLGQGVLFEFDYNTNAFQIKKDFGSSYGNAPEAGLISATNGKLYGTAPSGGANNIGVIFEYDITTDLFFTKYNFVLQNGSNPYGGVFQASNGKLYGMTNSGGLNNKGVLYEFDLVNNSYSKNIDFDGLNGRSPNNTLAEAPNGLLYGTTIYGGANDLGVFFEFNPSNSQYTKKLDFTGINGANPISSSIITSNGKLYCTTKQGGVNYAGVLFEYDFTLDSFSKKFDFNINNGANINGKLVQAPNGKLYGLSYNGGLNNGGVIFEVDPATNTYIKKIDFNGNNGNHPNGGLTLGFNGKLFGMTVYGGVNNAGILFEYDYVNNVIAKKVDFDGANKGGTPYGSLVQHSNGKLYGMTATGGSFDWGIIFEFDPSNANFTKKIDFTYATAGNSPQGDLIEGINGSLYGLTTKGGSHNKGNLFMFDLATNAFSNKYAFGATNMGSTPYGSLILASDGKMYGVTSVGGTSNKGTLFRFDPVSGVTSKLLDLDGTNYGYFPQGSLVQSYNGKIYGTTSLGGLNNRGILLEYDVLTSTCVKKLDFNANTGSGCYGQLMECYFTGFNITKNDITCPGGSNGSATVTVTGGTLPYSYLWNTAQTTSVITGLQTGVKTVTVTDANGYKVVNSVIITAPNPIVINQTFSICVGDSIVIGSNAYKVSGTYTNTFTSVYGCDSTVITNLNVNNPPVLVVNSGTVCTGSNFTITPTGANSYTYSSGSNIVSPIAVSIYTVTGANLIGCINTATLQVDINPSPTILIAGIPGPICEDTSVSLGVSGADTYTWSTSENTTTINISPSSTTIYSVTGTDLNNCLGTASTQVTVNQNPIISISNGAICEGQTYTLSPGGSSVATYIFSSGTDIVSPITTTDYTITGTDGNGCIGTTTMQLIVNPTPTLSIVQPSGNLCIGSSTVVFASSTSITSYSWSNGATTSSISVNPTLTTTYTVTGTDINSCSSTAIVNVTIDNNCQDVWPGDANSDGIADNLDILELGLHYTQTGTPRASTSNAWQSYFANNWTGTITNGKNLNHSDCNGDGTIDDNDTLAIYNNYGLTHAFKTAQTTTVNPQLNIVPDQASVVKGSWGTASIYVGDATASTNNINGLAFTVDFDNTLIETNSIYVEYQNSFMDAGQNLHFRKLDFVNSKLYTASTHTVSNNVTGFGKIATLHYQIKSSLTTDQVLNIGLAQANQSDALGTIVPLTSGTGTLMAIGASVGLQELNGNIVTISPNPTNGSLTINSKTELQKIEVVAITGQALLSETPTNVLHTLHLENFANGIYFVNMYQNDRVVKREKIVLNK